MLRIPKMPQKGKSLFYYCNLFLCQTKEKEEASSLLFLAFGTRPISKLYVTVKAITLRSHGSS